MQKMKLFFFFIFFQTSGIFSEITEMQYSNSDRAYTQYVYSHIADGKVIEGDVFFSDDREMLANISLGVLLPGMLGGSLFYGRAGDSSINPEIENNIKNDNIYLDHFSAILYLKYIGVGMIWRDYYSKPTQYHVLTNYLKKKYPGQEMCSEEKNYFVNKVSYEEFVVFPLFSFNDYLHIASKLLFTKTRIQNNETNFSYSFKNIPYSKDFSTMFNFYYYAPFTYNFLSENQVYFETGFSWLSEDSHISIKNMIKNNTTLNDYMYSLYFGYAFIANDELFMYRYIPFISLSYSKNQGFGYTLGFKHENDLVNLILSYSLNDSYSNNNVFLSKSNYFRLYMDFGLDSKKYSTFYNSPLFDILSH